MIELLHSEGFRVLAVIQMMLLVGCGSFLHNVNRHRLPWPAWPMGLAYSWVMACVALSVVLNLLTPNLPPTPGVKVFTVLLLPSTITVLVLTFRVMRRGVQPI